MQRLKITAYPGKTKVGPCRIAPLIGFLKKQITLSLGNTKVGTRRIAPLIRILFLGPNEFLVHFNLIGLIRNITAEQLYERANVKNITGNNNEHLYIFNDSGPRPSCNVSQVWFQMVRRSVQSPTAVMQRCSVLVELITCYIRYSKLHPLFHMCYELRVVHSVA